METPEFLRKFLNRKPKDKTASKEEKKKKEPKVVVERTPSDIEKYYLHRFADRGEYKKRRRKFAKQAASILVEGCGGIKNIEGVKLINYAVKVKFKNLYQVKEEVLRTTGGLFLTIGEHEMTDIFDFSEAKTIASLIKRELKRNKNKYVKMDVA